MPADTIVTDPYLRSVLAAAEGVRQQAFAILDMLEASPPPLTRDQEEAFEDQKNKLFTALSQVRSMNRTAIANIRQLKQGTAEARQEIDTLLLQLQNLHYEQNHLMGEIAACENYNHSYQKLPLIPVEEFLEKFPEHKDDDENTLMIARIEHEHAERLALEEQRQVLLKTKQGLITENKKRKDRLANLDKDLEKFIETATPIQKTFEEEY